MERFESTEDRIIARHGWAIRGVFASDDGSTPAFAYTVGLHDRGFPELITMGVEYQIAGLILNDVAGHLVRCSEQQDARLVTGPVVVEGWPVKFFLVWCHASELQGDVAAVLSRSDGNAAVVQVCWSDPVGRFPWEPGFEIGQMSAQPLLGTPPSAMH